MNHFQILGLKKNVYIFSKIKVDFRIVNCRFSLKAFIYIFIIPIFFNKV
jgi:hypothetical protein